MLMPNQLSTDRDLRELLFLRRTTWALLSLLVVVRLAYLAVDCPLDLAPDEAHYWDWSRHLDWSYYSKGPLVAWLIHGSCQLFGGLSIQLTGSEMMAVRLPAVLCGSLTLAALYLLTVAIYRNEKLALGVVLIGLTLPMLSAGSCLMTIDAPYICCWAWALVFGQRAIFQRRQWAWLATGAMVALGILAKYNMLAWIPSVGMFLLTSRQLRSLLWSRGFWLMSALALLGVVPILIWNLQHDWVSFRHVNSLAGGMQTRSTFDWLGPVNYLGGQCALLLVFWFFAWVAAMWTNRPWQTRLDPIRYLWWTSAPMFSVFLLFSFKNGGGELNWPAAAYISGLVLTAAWLTKQLNHGRRWYRRWVQVNLAITCVLGALLSVCMHRTEWIRPVLLALSGPETESRPFPLRRFDPTCRLRGWQTLAAEVDRLREQETRNGEEPILAATTWWLPGEIGFYCRNHPTVYCLGQIQGERHNQYDLWRPNPVQDAEQFKGRTFIIVGAPGPEILQAFKSWDEALFIRHREQGHAISGWHITIARDFQGFAPRNVTKRY